MHVVDMGGGGRKGWLWTRGDVFGRGSAILLLADEALAPNGG